MYQKTTLPNGLRIVSSEMPHTMSIAVTIFVGVGSRYESERESGMSHFIEHMLFKGTTKRPTSQEISETIEGVGGVMNAGTDKELTVYYTKSAKEQFGLSLDLLVDMIRNSRFDPEDVAKERQVVSEEINMIFDQPSELVGVLLEDMMWPNQPLGRDIAGTRETVGAFDRDQAIEYMRRHYVPGRIVVCVAGALPHSQVVEQVGALMGDWPVVDAPTSVSAVVKQRAPRLKLRKKRTEQANLQVAFYALPSGHPDRFALSILNVVLGEGMSSRLFLEVREKHALAYDVHSAVGSFRDTGLLAVYAATEPTRATKTVEAIMRELGRMRRDPILPEELNKAKQFTRGRMVLRMEDTRSVASWLGGQELLTHEIVTVDEALARIDAVTIEDVQRLANQLFVEKALNVAVVGPFPSAASFRDLLHF